MGSDEQIGVSLPPNVMRYLEHLVETGQTASIAAHIRNLTIKDLTKAVAEGSYQEPLKQ